jgi:pyrimidine-nucleoside phosphorylase
MRAVDLIARKRDGGILTSAEIQFLINGYVRADIPDYQMAAWAMAVLWRGMTAQEITDLTLAMAHSGEILDLKSLGFPIVVDKHSTGGVGDKTTLVVAPLVASMGLPVGKMSGRGLGFSGGTLDKLESIPGFNVNLTQQQFMDNLKQYGIVLAGQSADLAPADGKLYALRDVTATVESIPLIASSIMSKKIAAGADAIVLDVKVGSGAFMKTIEEAEALARTMVQIGEGVGRRVVAILSSMEQPLGCAIGNALEVREAIETLRGNGPADFTELCLTIAAQMLVLGKQAQTVAAARILLHDAIRSGRGLAKLRELIESQGGQADVVDHPDIMAKAAFIATVPCPRSAYVAAIDAAEVGLTGVDLGGGRATKGDVIDHAVGIVLHARVGDHTSPGQPLLTIHANDEHKLAAARKRLLAAYTWSAAPVAPPQLILRILDGQ